MYANVGHGYCPWGLFSFSGLGHGVWGWLALFLHLLFIALVVLGIIYLVRHLSTGSPENSGAQGSGESTPMEILERRYARGEIEEDEYQRKKEELSR